MTNMRDFGIRYQQATEMDGGNGITQRSRERSNTTESGAGQRAGHAGPARNEEAQQKHTAPFFLMPCVSAAVLRCVTRSAGLSRAAGRVLRSFSVAPFVCVIPFAP